MNLFRNVIFQNKKKSKNSKIPCLSIAKFQGRTGEILRHLTRQQRDDCPPRWKIASSKESIHSRDYYLPRSKGEEGEESPEVSPPLKSEWSGSMGKHLSSHSATRRWPEVEETPFSSFLPSFLPISFHFVFWTPLVIFYLTLERFFSRLPPPALREEGREREETRFLADSISPANRVIPGFPGCATLAAYLDYYY